MVLANADPVVENFHFLRLKLQQQVKRCLLYLVSSDVKAAVTLIDDNDYVINLTTVVKNHCIKGISDGKDERTVLIFRNIYDISNILSNISVSIVELLRHVSEDILHFLNGDQPTEELLCMTLNALNKLESIFDVRNSNLGNKLSNISEEMQESVSDYAAHIAKQQLVSMQESGNESLPYVIAMFTNISLNMLHLSEAVLSIEQNKVVTIRQFQALKAALKKVGGTKLAEEALVEGVGETKSGCSIVAVSANETARDYMAIFKEGKKDKIKDEKKHFETWNKIIPGVAPRVFSYKKKGRSAGILVEYLKGKTFEQLLLSKNMAAIDVALDGLCETLESLWITTKSADNPQSALYVSQIKKRLPSILRVHPEYDQPGFKIGDYKVISLRKLLDECEAIESKIETPFNAFTHGDFNIDNVIFDSENGKPRFIDLHRSKDTDYLQDVSVFMISNYRIKVVDPDIRFLINRVMVHMYQWVDVFSKVHDDNSFQARLCLGMARSYITSTRFTLDENHADNMFMRGRYLLEKLMNTPDDQLQSFKIPQEIFYG